MAIFEQCIGSAWALWIYKRCHRAKSVVAGVDAVCGYFIEGGKEIRVRRTAPIGCDTGAGA